MGRMGAMGMAEQVGEGNVSLRGALVWHLQSNHYPPHPIYMVELAEKALEYARREEWDTMLDMPDGVMFRGGVDASVYDIIVALHLEDFINVD